ncbi:hypothetical protein KC878_01085 [Candidatus Saccharibacteria bacterium]|nr:hypothetical protein [Candidatus Saccharibacteria bacterium]MCB9821158.1 hypothetical protein [Candidatus Nomurabacteria bacterium]
MALSIEAGEIGFEHAVLAYQVWPDGQSISSLKLPIRESSAMAVEEIDMPETTAWVTFFVAAVCVARVRDESAGVDRQMILSSNTSIPELELEDHVVIERSGKRVKLAPL